MHGLQIAFVTTKQFKIISEKRSEVGLEIAEINGRYVMSCSSPELTEHIFYVRGLYDYSDLYGIDFREDFNSRDLVEVVADLNETHLSKIIINSWDFMGNKWSHNVNSLRHD